MYAAISLNSIGPISSGPADLDILTSFINLNNSSLLTGSYTLFPVANFSSVLFPVLVLFFVYNSNPRVSDLVFKT